MTALIARFVCKEKLRPYQWGAIFVEFMGVVVLTVLSSGMAVNGGLFWLLIAGEVPDAATLAGGVVILVGVLLFNFGGRVGKKVL